MNATACPHEELRAIRAMMEEVADKAAKTAAQSVSNEIRLEMLQMEQRLRSEIMRDMRNTLNEALGMKPTEHAVQHSEMSKVVKDVEALKGNLLSRVLTIILTASLAIAGGKATGVFDSSKAAFVQQAPPRDKNRENDAPNS